MSNQTRYKGRFVTKKMLEKKRKVGALLLEARKRSRKEVETENVCDGRRIVELSVLGKNLQCCKCGQVLSLEKTVKETRLGLNSILTVRCDSCCVNTRVPTGTMHTAKDAGLSDINTKAVLGAVHAGVSSTALNKLLTCLDIPSIPDNLFKQYEREVAPAIEESAKESCSELQKKSAD